MIWPTLWRRKRREPEITPEIALIMQELDEELAREHELLADGIGTQSRDVGSLLRGFAQRCDKVALVGSHRRGVPDPKDIDVLFVPKSTLQTMEFIESVCDDERSIEKLGAGWRCRINGHQVDFLRTTTASWGLNLICFTGSREFNERFIRHAERRNYQIKNGRPTITIKGTYHDWDTDAFAGWSEEKILKHLGLQEYLDPRTRN